MGRREYTTHSVDAELDSIQAQSYDRGRLYVAEDVRREYQFVSHTICGLKVAIEAHTNQSVSKSSLYEASAAHLKHGRTGGCFAVRRMPRDAARSYLNDTRQDFRRRVWALIDPSALQVVATA